MAKYTRLEGVDDILKELRQVEKEARHEVVKVLHDQSQLVVEDARDRAPKDTGAMAKGIRRSVSAKKLEATISAGGKVGGVDTYYARFIELGTKKMPAQPFFFTACRAHEEEIGRALSDALFRLIERGKA